MRYGYITNNVFFCLFFLMAALIAHGSSQARDWIRATAVTYTTSCAGSFNPLGQAGDWTGISPVTWTAAVGFLTHCAAAGTPAKNAFEYKWNIYPHWKNLMIKD